MVFFYYCLHHCLIPAQCALLVPTFFKNAAKDFRFKQAWTRAINQPCKPKTIDRLKQSIQHEWNQISEETCQKVCRSVVKRCLDCTEVQGRHFEQL